MINCKKRYLKGATDMDCLFCAIINGDIPSKKVYEDEFVYSFLDINPQAPVHALVVPKQHIASLDCISADNSTAVAHVLEAIPKIARELGLDNGYRVISNVGEDGCQSVKHIHFHVLGGKKLSENMG
jgi:histidine triad (HIT) family protein